MKRNCVNRKNISEAVGNIDERYIEEAAEFQVKESAKGHARKYSQLKWIAIAACICLVIVGVTGFTLFKIAHPWPVEIVRMTEWGPSEPLTNMMEVIPCWEEQPIYNQYGTIEWNRVTYNSRSAQLPAERIGELLGNTIARGHDYYAESEEDSGDRQIDVKVYAVTKISSECLVAVQYEGTDTWYAFTNIRYRPQTLGQFIEDLNLREEVQFGSVHYSYTSYFGNHVNVSFDNVEDDVIWEWLLTETSAENVYDQSQLHLMPREERGISVDIPLWGTENIALSVCEDGYIWTNIFGTGKLFYIGEENTEGFKEYLRKECEGRETIYILPKSNDSGSGTEGESGGASSPSVPAKSSEAQEPSE